MLDELFANSIFLYIILGVFVLGAITKAIIMGIYHNLIHNSKKMGTSNNKLMRTIRLKFETCYKLKIGVNNVDIFVDKYVYRHKVCGILLYTWETFSGLFMILPALIGSTAAGLGIIYDSGQSYILSTFLAGLFASVILLVVDYCYSIRLKRMILRTNIKDYLENFLKVRLEDKAFDPSALEAYRAEYEEQRKEVQQQKKKKEVAEATSVSNPDLVNGKKEATRRSLEEKARERREARKNELKKMIEDDKKKKQTQTVKQTQETKQEPQQKKKETQPETIKKELDSKEKTIEAEKESAVTMNAQPKEEFSSKTMKKDETPNSKENKEIIISKEEEKLIHDILKEFFGE